MPSIINASSSGSGGIVQTADASGILQLQSNGTVALSISGAATTFGGNMLLEASGNPTMTVKTTGAGNNPLYRLQADTNYWDMLGVFSDANDTLRFRYNGSDKMVMNNGGIIALAGGDSDATGVGITFPSTQVASTNANTLDDYEEGTWSVNVQNNGSTSSWVSKVGYYRKVGSVVTCWFACGGGGNSNGGSGSGAVILIGLPFAMAVGTTIQFMGQVAAQGASNASGYDWISSAGSTGTNAQILSNAAGNQEQNQLTNANGVFTYIAS